MSGFTKLVPEIIQSSIWNESSDIRIVWITLLAIKDQDGYVRGDVNTLTRLANVSKEWVEEALKKFQSPDPDSHIPDDEGRRIEAMPGGWKVINHERYRIKDRNAYMREYMREKRKKKEVNSVNVNITSASVSASVSVPSSLSASPAFLAAWDNWQSHRQEIRHKLTPSCAAAQLKEFEGWGPDRAVGAIEYTIKKGWQGIQEPPPAGAVPGKSNQTSAYMLSKRLEILEQDLNTVRNKNFQNSHCEEIKRLLDEIKTTKARITAATK